MKKLTLVSVQKGARTVSVFIYVTVEPGKSPVVDAGIINAMASVAGVHEGQTFSIG